MEVEGRQKGENEKKESEGGGQGEKNESRTEMCPSNISDR